MSKYAKQNKSLQLAWRKYLTWLLLAIPFVGLSWRAYDLQILRSHFLTLQRDARIQRSVSVPAYRGKITDRFGEPLAVSTPVDSIWVNPSEILASPEQIVLLAKLLDLQVGSLKEKFLENGSREFVYVKRHISPHDANKALKLEIEGVYRQREYHRFYPTGEVTAHLLGFTDIDDQGQEGLELAFNDWLSGTPGLKRVIKDRLGHVIENVESIREANPGKDIRLSIDKRLQYLAYRALKAAVQKHNSLSGSVVLLDSQSNEILAMVNQPAFNPNNRKGLRGENYRNRAITDVFEPGSTMKPFSIVAALESGLYNPNSVIDTSPGYVKIAGYTLRDLKNYKKLDLSGILLKSSNIGAIKLALSMPAQQIWSVYDRVGFGISTSSGYPGESSGFLSHYTQWGQAEQATMSYGYGLAVTALQLAQAYSVLARDGYYQPISLLARDNQEVDGKYVMDQTIAKQVRQMLREVVTESGSGKLASVPGYTVAGKTGTSHKSQEGGYAEDRYFSLFAGFAPANNPRLVAVVMINDPKGKDHFGGQVAAPVFSRVMSDALRLMNIAPDNYDEDLLHRVAAAQ